LTLELCRPLKTAYDGYNTEMSRLHPFEKVVCDLTITAREKRDGVGLSDVLLAVNEARKEVLSLGKSLCVAIKEAPTAKEAIELIEPYEKQLKELYLARASHPVLQLIEMQKSLRTVPAVHLDVPAVVLVGSPNVGKSSIVRKISTGTPEINNYPFTTRGMTLGHIVKDFGGYKQYAQIMDSPGLLNRDDGMRNEMEKLTVASLQHLPTAVMFVYDMSGGAGDACSSVADQIVIRKELRGRFPKRPWIDVIAKKDLGYVDQDLVDEVYAINAADNRNSGVIEVSVVEDEGVDALVERVDEVLERLRIVLDVIEARESK
jgi:nucleolar GTP-binding protein